MSEKYSSGGGGAFRIENSNLNPSPRLLNATSAEAKTNVRFASETILSQEVMSKSEEHFNFIQFLVECEGMSERLVSKMEVIP